MEYIQFYLKLVAISLGILIPLALIIILATQKGEKEMSTKGIVEQYLLSLGVEPNLKGFRYLRDMIILVVDNESEIDKVMELYKKVAFTHKDSYTNVERAARHAISTIDNEKYKDKKNANFIALVALEVRNSVAVVDKEWGVILK